MNDGEFKRLKVELLETSLAHLSAADRPFSHLVALLINAYERGGVLEGEALGYALADVIATREELDELAAWLKSLRAEGIRSEADNPARARRVK